MTIVEIAIECVIVRSVLRTFRSQSDQTKPKKHSCPFATLNTSVPDEITRLRMLEQFVGTRSIDEPDKPVLKITPQDESEINSLLVTIMGARK